MSFKKKFFKNIATFGSYNYLGQVIEFLSTVIVSRIILPSEYGFVALILVFSEFVYIFTNIGISHAVIRSDYTHKYRRLLVSLSIWIGFAQFLVISGLAYPIALFYGDKALILPTLVIAVQFIGQSLTAVPYAVLFKELKFSLIGQYRLIVQAIEIALIILLAFLGFSYWSLILPRVISPFLHYAILYYKLHIGIVIYNFRTTLYTFRKIRSLISSIAGYGIINYWSRNLDNMLIGKYFGNAELGFYNRAYRFLYIAQKLITTIFGQVLYPSFKEHKDKGGNYLKEYNDILGVISFMVFPMALLLVVFPEPLVLFLWGRNWIEVARFLPYVGVLAIVQTLLLTVTEVFVLENKEKMIFKIGGVAAFASVSAIIFGIFFDALIVIKLLALVHVVIIMPVFLIFGFYMALGQPWRGIVRFWLPKWVLSVLLMVALESKEAWPAYLVMGTFFAHLVQEQWQNLKIVTMMLIGRLRKK